MGSLKMIWSLAALVGLSAPALAADMLPPPPPEAGPAASELGTGWYLRGDIGYVDYNQFRGNHDIAGAFDKAVPDRTWSAGGGFGYKFTNLFRADVTVDHRFASDVNSVTDLGGGAIRNEWGKLESTTALANGYIDLGNWSGFTPYLGAGVGGVDHLLHEFRTQVSSPFGVQPVVSVRAHDRWDLAWALMAGVAVDVGGGFKIDAGYRYVNLGEAEMRFAPATPALRSKEFEAHEVRVGFRYMIDQP